MIYAKDAKELEERIKNLDDLYENDLNIGFNVNLLQAIPNKSVKVDSQNTLTLEFCSMSLDDLINNNLISPLILITSFSYLRRSLVLLCFAINKTDWLLRI